MMKQREGSWFKYQRCDPELKETTSQTTAGQPKTGGPAKDNHQASTNNF